jgi:hypothetical protein
MFGLEGQRKKKKHEEFVFDLEKELLKIKSHEEIYKKVLDRMQRLKTALQTGESDKQEFDRMGVMVLGYASLLKVVSRFSAK